MLCVHLFPGSHYAKTKVTPEIKLQADAVVARFNFEQLRGQPWAHYVTNYRGAHLYRGHAKALEAGWADMPADLHR